MKIHAVNDLHLEISLWMPTPSTVVAADLVVLAGDIGRHTHGLEWARTAFADKRIVYVAGNHEFYFADMRGLAAQMRKAALDLGIDFLDNGEVVVGGMRFLGCTLWTDFALFEEEERNARAMEEAGTKMGDFRHIMAGRRDGGYGKNKLIPFTPAMSRKRHLASRAWLEGELARPHDGPTVVVTHHAPSARSLSYQEPSWLLDAAYASDLDHLMGEEQVRLWGHGHTHLATDYELKGTRVVSNPRGYVPGEVVGEFKPELVVRI